MIVIYAGWDAVDAGHVVARLTARGRTAGLRTAKSCGPDAPMLGSSSREANASQGRRWQLSASATRRANQQKPVQPLLQKYSDFPKTQITCITLLVLSHRGAARDRHGRGAGCGGRKRRF